MAQAPTYFKAGRTARIGGEVCIYVADLNAVDGSFPATTRDKVFVTKCSNEAGEGAEDFQRDGVKYFARVYNCAIRKLKPDDAVAPCWGSTGEPPRAVVLKLSGMSLEEDGGESSVTVQAPAFFKAGRTVCVGGAQCIYVADLKTICSAFPADMRDKVFVVECGDEVRDGAEDFEHNGVKYFARVYNCSRRKLKPGPAASYWEANGGAPALREVISKLKLMGSLEADDVDPGRPKMVQAPTDEAGEGAEDFQHDGVKYLARVYDCTRRKVKPDPAAPCWESRGEFPRAIVLKLSAMSLEADDGCSPVIAQAPAFFKAGRTTICTAFPADMRDKVFVVECGDEVREGAEDFEHNGVKYFARVYNCARRKLKPGPAASYWAANGGAPALREVIRKLRAVMTLEADGVDLVAPAPVAAPAPAWSGNPIGRPAVVLSERIFWAERCTACTWRRRDEEQESEFCRVCNRLTAVCDACGVAFPSGYYVHAHMGPGQGEEAEVVEAAGRAEYDADAYARRAIDHRGFLGLEKAFRQIAPDGRLDAADYLCRPCTIRTNVFAAPEFRGARPRPVFEEAGPDRVACAFCGLGVWAGSEATFDPVTNQQLTCVLCADGTEVLGHEFWRHTLEHRDDFENEWTGHPDAAAEVSVANDAVALMRYQFEPGGARQYRGAAKKYLGRLVGSFPRETQLQAYGTGLWCPNYLSKVLGVAVHIAASSSGRTPVAARKYAARMMFDMLRDTHPVYGDARFRMYCQHPEGAAGLSCEVSAARGIYAVVYQTQPQRWQRDCRAGSVFFPTSAQMDPSANDIHQKRETLSELWELLIGVEFPLLFPNDVHLPGRVTFVSFLRQYFARTDTSPAVFTDLNTKLLLRYSLNRRQRAHLRFARYYALHHQGRKPTRLPGNIPGSFEQVAEQRARAFAIMRRHGAADLMVTVTASDGWPEMTRERELRGREALTVQTDPVVFLRDPILFEEGFDWYITKERDWIGDNYPWASAAQDLFYHYHARSCLRPGSIKCAKRMPADLVAATYLDESGFLQLETQYGEEMFAPIDRLAFARLKSHCNAVGVGGARRIRYVIDYPLKAAPPVRRNDERAAWQVYAEDERRNEIEALHEAQRLWATDAANDLFDEPRFGSTVSSGQSGILRVRISAEKLRASVLFSGRAIAADVVGNWLDRPPLFGGWSLERFAQDTIASADPRTLLAYSLAHDLGDVELASLRVRGYVLEVSKIRQLVEANECGRMGHNRMRNMLAQQNAARVVELSAASPHDDDAYLTWLLGLHLVCRADVDEFFANPDASQKRWRYPVYLGKFARALAWRWLEDEHRVQSDAVASALRAAGVADILIRATRPDLYPAMPIAGPEVELAERRACIEKHRAEIRANLPAYAHEYSQLMQGVPLQGGLTEGQRRAVVAFLDQDSTTGEEGDADVCVVNEAARRQRKGVHMGVKLEDAKIWAVYAMALLGAADIIICDEFAMANASWLETAERKTAAEALTWQHLQGLNLAAISSGFWGGKKVLLLGDTLQIPAVVRNLDVADSAFLVTSLPGARYLDGVPYWRLLGVDNGGHNPRYHDAAWSAELDNIRSGVTDEIQLEDFSRVGALEAGGEEYPYEWLRDRIEALPGVDGVNLTEIIVGKHSERRRVLRVRREALLGKGMACAKFSPLLLNYGNPLIEGFDGGGGVTDKNRDPLAGWLVVALAVRSALVSTIHSYQGRTVPAGVLFVISLATFWVMHGIVYAALSRPRHKEQIHFYRPREVRTLENIVEHGVFGLPPEPPRQFFG
eukprot:g17745.t1